jgi:hypothetical protein
MVLKQGAGLASLSAEETMGSPSLSTLNVDPSKMTPEEIQAFIEARRLQAKKAEWASWANAEYTKCKNARSQFERQWYINLAFLSGQQYLQPVNLTAAGFRLVTPKAPPWRVRLVINKIRTAIRTECSKLTTSKPIPTVLPATNEDEDFTAAQVGEQILKSKFNTTEFSAQYRSWVWWGSVCGTSFLKQHWDPSALDHESRMIPKPPLFPGTDLPIPDEIVNKIPALQEYMNTPKPARGKINVERITPFHILVPDLLSEGLEDQPYLIHTMAKSKLWVEKRFPEAIPVTCDTRTSATILGSAAIVTAKGGEEHLDAVLVKEVWIKPEAHKDFPEGGLLTIVNDKVVQCKEKWPYPFPEFPFYKYGAIDTGGFYSDSIIVDLIPIQKEYNKKRSQAIEIQNTVGKPKFVYQHGSLDPRMITSEPGQSIPYRGGYDPPIPIDGAEVPASFSNEIAQLAVEFDDISGQHEISRGDTPNSAISSGTAIAYLQEQDDSKLSYQVSTLEGSIELLGKHHLFLVSHYWEDDRVIKVVGHNDTFEAIHWKQNMLKGNMDVRVQTGSALPFSKAARTALLTEMMQNGWVDPQSGMEMLNFGGLEKVLDVALVDKRQAMRENLRMAAAPEKLLMLLLNPAPAPDGTPPPPPMVDPNTGQEVKFNGDGTPFQPQPPFPVNSWDNHEEHIHWHNFFRKTQQFEQLSEVQKEAFEMHVQLHQLALQSQLVNQQGQILEDNSGMQQEPPLDEEVPPGEEESPANSPGGPENLGNYS